MDDVRDCKEGGAHGHNDDVRDCQESGARDEERRHRSPRFKRRSSKSTTTFAP